MKRYLLFGKTVKAYRLRKTESITNVAKSVGVDRTYLSKLENGHERPSIEVLNKLIRHYLLSRQEANMLSDLAGYKGSGLVVVEQLKREEVEGMSSGRLEEQPAGVEINIPNDKPVLYSDVVYILSNKYGVVFDFAQRVGPTNKQNVVCRIGMSREHAKDLLNALKNNLEKEESQSVRTAVS